MPGHNTALPRRASATIGGCVIVLDVETSVSNCRAARVRSAWTWTWYRRGSRAWGRGRTGRPVRPSGTRRPAAV